MSLRRFVFRPERSGPFVALRVPKPAITIWIYHLVGWPVFKEHSLIVVLLDDDFVEVNG